MLNPSNGLRFDVYERVHLPVDVADIHELDEIELTPQIQVVHQGEQVLLRGSLLLNGVYASQGETRETRVLEHWIPVEITLPLNRVRSLEDISVEVENFDVDLLSARTLNITGVLSLRGVEVREAEAAPAPPAWVDEPFTVVHQREQELQEARSEPEPEPGLAEAEAAAIPEQIEQSEQREAAGSGSAELEPVQWTNLAAFQHEAADAQPSIEPDSRAEMPQEASAPAALPPEQAIADAAAQGGTHAADRPAVQEAAAEAGAQEYEPQSEASIPLPETPEAIAADAPPVQEAEAKPDLKIGLGAKKTENPPEQSQSLGLSSLLQSNRREQEFRQAAAEQEQAKQQAEAAALASAQGEEIEWKSLFLSREPNAEAFRKVRMCIVQRDDTLDAIAGRYQLNPREIVLYNRLAQHEVAEGQVLLIP